MKYSMSLREILSSVLDGGKVYKVEDLKNNATVRKKPASNKTMCLRKLRIPGNTLLSCQKEKCMETRT